MRGGSSRNLRGRAAKERAIIIPFPQRRERCGTKPWNLPEPNKACYLPREVVVGFRDWTPMMLTLAFYRTGDKIIHSAGPVRTIQIAGGSLRVGPDGRQLAQYHDGLWRVDGHDVPKYIVSGSGPILLEGERPGKPVQLGEYAQLEIVDGAIYTRPGCALLARFDDSSASWYIYQDKGSCSSVFIQESHTADRLPNPSTSTISGSRGRSPA
jgi:hypothetical protein